MEEGHVHSGLTSVQLFLAAVTALYLRLVRAPYGRHSAEGWGPEVPSRLGWMLMESPAVLFFTFIFFLGQHCKNRVPILFFTLWQLHYIHRTFVFPLKMRSPNKPMPLLLVCVAFLFNCLNSYINSRYISHIHMYDDSWLHAPHLWIGTLIFLAGFAINVKADSMLLSLRRPGDIGYKIPRGWLFEYVSCPNYFGEILEWIGWTCATWSLPAATFAIYTASNLGPRAMHHHNWYQSTFERYPPGRKAIIPFVL